MKAVLDTNMVIYLQKGLLAEKLPIGEYFISVITEMELLSFDGLSDLQRQWLRRFIDAINKDAILFSNDKKLQNISELRVKFIALLLNNHN